MQPIAFFIWYSETEREEGNVCSHSLCRISLFSRGLLMEVWSESNDCPTYSSLGGWVVQAAVVRRHAGYATLLQQLLQQLPNMGARQLSNTFWAYVNLQDKNLELYKGQPPVLAPKIFRPLLYLTPWNLHVVFFPVQEGLPCCNCWFWC